VTGKARHRGWVGLASTVLLLSALAPVRAAVEAELIDRQLESQPVRLQVLSDGEMMYFGADRTLKREPMSRFVAVRFRGSAEADPEDQQGRVERTDGQRLTGNLLAGREDGQGLRWEHPDLGEASLSLDDLSRFHRPGAEPTEPAGGDDRVVLRNGDALTGFVEAVQPDQLMLDPAEGDELVPLPLENIAAVALANRQRPWPADTHRLRLAAGSRLAIETLELRDDGLAVDTDWLGSGLSLPIEAVNVIELTSGGLRLVDLTDRPREVTGGGAVFGVTMPPRARGDGLWLHAPVTVRVELPAGARRVAAAMELLPEADRDPAVAEAAGWAGCDLTVESEAGSQTITLGPGQNRDELNLEVAGDALTLRLEPGRNGPVLDRLLLRRPRVLVERSENAEAD